MRKVRKIFLYTENFPKKSSFSAFLNDTKPAVTTFKNLLVLEKEKNSEFLNDVLKNFNSVKIKIFSQNFLVKKRKQS